MVFGLEQKREAEHLRAQLEEWRAATGCTTPAAASAKLKAITELINHPDPEAAVRRVELAVAALLKGQPCH